MVVVRREREVARARPAVENLDRPAEPAEAGIVELVVEVFEELVHLRELRPHRRPAGTSAR